MRLILLFCDWQKLDLAAPFQLLMVKEDDFGRFYKVQFLHGRHLTHYGAIAQFLRESG